MQKRDPEKFASPWIAEQSIRAAAVYMAQLHGQWSSPRPPMDRYMLALASYNAGLGNILSAQKECGGALLYREIIDCLPRVTGRHSAETIDYTNKIVGVWFPRLLLGR